MDAFDTILVTGANGFIGSNLISYLENRSYRNVFGLLSSDCDLTDRRAAQRWFQEVRPAYVFHCAARVRGIAGNMQNQSDGFLKNCLINTHVVEACQIVGVKKIVAMGTVAMYPDSPKDAERGFVECEIWEGPPHESEKGYAHAKRAMLAQLDTSGLSFALPVCTNMYGGADRFNIETGHCIPSLVRKAYEAKRDGKPMTVWGDGSARRDFLYVKDVARALHLVMDKISGPVNLATGATHSIKDAATILAECAGCEIEWDTSKPTGQVTRAYDVSTLSAAGFAPRHTLEQGLRETYQWYVKNEAVARKN
jgi:GDP-L-fucose synthase